MDEKVVLTRDQANAVESAKKRYGKDQFLYEFSRMLHEISPLQFTGSLGPINDLALHRVAKALYIGYEVESELEVGDWVVRTKELNHQNFHEGKIFKVKRIVKGHLTKDLLVVDNDDNSEHLFENIRHATPEEIAKEKERIWWSERGRDVWELKVLDKIRLSNVEYEVIEVCRKGVYKVRTNESVPFDTIYVTNDQSKVGGKDEIELIEENDSKVVCFREDRKDV